jgi:type I restriction enzyme S subunit
MNDIEDPDLPDGWAWARLEELADPSPYAMTDGPFGSNLKTSDYVDSGVRVIRLGNIGVAEFVDTNRSFVSREKFESLRKHEVFPGDLVIAALAEPVGRCVEVPANLGKAIVKADCVRFKPRSEVCRSFLVYALNSPGGRQRAEAASHGIGRLRMNMGDMRSLSVPLPPLNEQRRIVAKLDGLMARSRRVKDAVDAIPKLLEQFRQSILAAAFRGDLTRDWRAKNPDAEPAEELLKRIRIERRKKWEEGELAKMRAKGKVPEDDRWKARYEEWSAGGGRDAIGANRADVVGLGELPESWGTARLGEAAPLQPGFAFRSDWYRKTGVRLMRGTNIVPNGIRWDDMECLTPERAAEFAEYELRAGEIVLAMDRPVVSSGLKVARLTADDAPSLLLQRVGRFQVNPLIDAEYLFCFLNSHHFASHITDRATGTQLPHVSGGDVDSVLLPLPPREEQRLISVRLRDALARVVEASASVVSCGDAREMLEKALLAKAFRGELVPQDLSDEPASVLLDRLRAASVSPSAKAKRTSRTRHADPDL